MKREDQIASARRHVLQSERYVGRQREIVIGLKAAGLDATIAEDLLARYEAALTAHRTQLERLG